MTARSKLDADPPELGPEENGQARHARVQAWRAEDRTRPPQGEKPEAGDRDRAQRGRRLEVRFAERTQAQPPSNQDEGAARRDRPGRGRRTAPPHAAEIDRA